MEWTECHALSNLDQLLNWIFPSLFDHFGSDAVILLLRPLDIDPNLSFDLTDFYSPFLVRGPMPDPLTCFF
jgi:hypothetical protein